MYGNNLSNDWAGTWIFPFIMSKLLDYFSYNYSRFNYSKYKESTAWISLFKELKIPNVFTMEASFLGPDTGEFKGKHFNTSHFEKSGQVLLEALIIYSGLNIWKLVKEYGLPELDKE